MDKEKVDRLSDLSALQIALLAMAASTVAAVATLLGLRRLGIVRRRSNAHEVGVPAQPAVPVTTGASFPNHFSEDIVVPGLTHTGADVQAQDERDGRSPEGV
jgi:hypothetical protein